VVDAPADGGADREIVVVDVQSHLVDAATDFAAEASGDA
jgi:hypothetical protein